VYIDAYISASGARLSHLESGHLVERETTNGGNEMEPLYMHFDT
jgi:hypothetical protein